MTETIKVTFARLAKYQSHDCLFCGNQATQQAETPKIKGYSAAIRCCPDPSCTAQAKTSAQDCMKKY